MSGELRMLMLFRMGMMYGQLSALYGTTMRRDLTNEDLDLHLETTLHFLSGQCNELTMRLEHEQEQEAKREAYGAEDF